MATTAANKPTLAKQLKEHLQDQQEPFNLSKYLSERRHAAKKLSSDDGNTCCVMNSTENRKEKYGKNTRRNLQNLRTLKSMLYRIFDSGIDKEELSTCRKDVKDQLISETIDMMKQIAETNWFSTESRGSEFSGSPGSGVPQNSPSSEIDKDTDFSGNPGALNLRHFEEQMIHTNNGATWKTTSNQAP